MSVEAGASALVTSARLASFSHPAAIASIVDRVSASRILSARLLASAARAIHCVEVSGSSMPCRVAHPTPTAKSHLGETAQPTCRTPAHATFNHDGWHPATSEPLRRLSAFLAVSCWTGYGPEPVARNVDRADEVSSRIFYLSVTYHTSVLCAKPIAQRPDPPKANFHRGMERCGGHDGID